MDELAALGDVVEHVDAVTVELPIPEPLQLGTMAIDRRRYTVVRIRTRDGVIGWSAALSRDCPVAAIVSDVLSPLVVGHPADDIARLHHTMVRSTLAPGRVGLVMRAISLVEIALWDAAGTRAGVPLWRLLAPDAEARPLPTVLVAGYPTRESPTEVGHRLGELCAAGHGLVKLSRRADPTHTSAILRTAARSSRAGSGLVVDAGWWWETASAALEELAVWADSGPVAWVEDPLVPEDVAGYQQLVEAGVAPIGVGDELTDERVAIALVDQGVTVSRVEAPSIGGVTAALRVAEHAARSGAQVSFHVYPELHVHLATALRGRATVEVFESADNPWDPAALLWQHEPDVAPGVVRAPDRPGLGTTIDIDVVRRHTVGPPFPS